MYKIIPYRYLDELGKSCEDSDEFDKFPDTCPHCGVKVAFTIRFCYKNNFNYFPEHGVVLECTNSDCKKISYVTLCGNASMANSYYIQFPTSTKTKEIPASFIKIVSNFTEIYKQAQLAENNGLNEICGMGYRKALEFLVKDYLINLYPKEKENIINEWLGTLIKKKINNPNIKILAEKCSWLGNDECHYVKKHTDRDLDDLKKLLDTLIKYIDMELTVADAITIE